MDPRKLSRIFVTLGALTTLGALLWWASFYGGVMRELDQDASLIHAISCLYSSGGECGFISELAQWAGATPYTPTVFWIGAVLLISGIIMNFALKGSTTPQKPTGEPVDFKPAGKQDSFGFDEKGHRLYKEFIIERNNSQFIVDGQNFSTLGKAKRYVSERMG